MKHPIWQFDEFRQVGRDYSRPDEVDIYDPSHAQFRDLVAEAEEILSLLDIRPDEVLVDIGAGTGTFALQAARRGAEVHALDVSRAMLDRARSKAGEAGLTGITHHHAGFLTHELPAAFADAVTTTYALHHLPDFWKGVALERIHRLLKPGGRLFIRDIVIPSQHSMETIGAFIARQEAAGGDFLREDAEGHFRDEHSTYDWAMDGLLTRAGFTIESKRQAAGVICDFLCARYAES